MGKSKAGDSTVFAEELVGMVNEGQAAVVGELLRLESSQRSAGLAAIAAIVQNAEKLKAACAGTYVSTRKRGGTSGT